ncbi:MAG: hypothetical protein KAT69_07890 [Candidatus Aminicenantes bacterium]|nr:hypothetical protein [Candidatus Aminicenantes bacterium]
MNRLKKYLKEKKIIDGDKVQWTYIHHLNSKSSVRKTKVGKFIRGITSERVDGGSRITHVTYGLVHFEGNKNPSRVLISELTKVKQGEKIK